jgi:hypothetical protein
MFISREMWEKMQDKIRDLEQNDRELGVNQRTLVLKQTIDVPKKSETYPGCFITKFEAVPLKHIVLLILEHLGLKIVEEPAKEAKFKLTAKKLEKLEESKE